VANTEVCRMFARVGDCFRIGGENEAAGAPDAASCHTKAA